MDDKPIMILDGVEFYSFPIEEWQGYYHISKCGEVYSLRKRKVRKNGKTSTGYIQTACCLDNKVKLYLVHRLVAMRFIPNPLNKPAVNHINSDRADNRVENLEWCTARENFDHCVKMGRWSYVGAMSGGLRRFREAGNNIFNGEKNGASKLKAFQVLEIRRKYVPHKYTKVMLSKEYGVSKGTVERIISRNGWKWLKDEEPITNSPDKEA